MRALTLQLKLVAGNGLYLIWGKLIWDAFTNAHELDTSVTFMRVMSDLLKVNRRKFQFATNRLRLQLGSLRYETSWPN